MIALAIITATGALSLIMFSALALAALLDAKRERELNEFLRPRR